MGDVKGKMKGLMKKINKPYSSTPTAFTGKGHVLGSAPSSSSSTSCTPANANPSRLPPPTRPSAPANPPVPKNSSSFDPFEPLITSGKRSGSAGSAATVLECPVCSLPFLSEEAVSDHIDSCLGPSKDAGSSVDVASRVSDFLTAEPADVSTDVVIKLLRNVAREPGNEKFRRIRMGNPKIKEAIVDVRGGLELLESVGFKIVEEDGESLATMEEPKPENIVAIQETISLIERWRSKDLAVSVNGTAESGQLELERASEPQKIDRKVRVFFSVPESVAAKIDLPESFYKLSVEEIRREAESRKKKIAESQLLIPKSLKEKQAMNSWKKYKFTVIRVQFPDGVVLQGEFSTWERTTALYEFVSSALKEDSLEFDLLSPAVPRVHVIPRFSGTVGRTPTLEEEKLVPSALIKFKPVETDSIVFTGLANELLEIIEPLTGTSTTTML
ncbi:hypothetical protein AXF42_Ash014360 [Apostasia shenzhenica]|uniref:UBX domain-containing protein n=1 Tax=Apostasia shenzhenica TaxID=1088818 RepID=A0A2I0B0V8_9ASPA|nr:hypothetical protein AXF42_Ash014360 [Apostasia shenzhenica]